MYVHNQSKLPFFRGNGVKDTASYLQETNLLKILQFHPAL